MKAGFLETKESSWSPLLLFVSSHTSTTKYLQLTAVHFSIFARKTVVYCRGVLVKEFFKAFRISELVLEAFRIKLPLDPRLI